MNHDSSSDEDLPDLGAALGSAPKRPYTVEQPAAIVLSDSDSDCGLAERLMNRISDRPAAVKRHAMSSDSDSDGGVGGRGAGVSAGLHVDYRGVTQAAASVTASPGIKRKKRTAEEIAQTKWLADLKKLEREREKEKKRQEKEAKTKTKEVEAAKRRFMQETKRAAKPGECLKYLTVMVDPQLVRRTCGARIVGLTTERGQRFEIQPQPHPNLICFWREVSEGRDLPGNQFEVVKKEVVEDQLLLWLPVSEFIEHVQAQYQEKCGLPTTGILPLRAFIQSLQKKLEDRKVTILVQGLQKYYKEQTIAKGRGRAQNRQVVSRLDVEETLVDVQFTTECNIRFTETDEETARLVLHYAKAVAEAPFKRDRSHNNALNIHIDTATCVKLDADGSGLTRAWRQIIQIFRSVGAEVANAIMAEFPTPRALCEAYKACPTEKEGVKLLENIMVRRGYGVMETNRRVGKELAKKLYVLFTVTDSEICLK